MKQADILKAVRNKLKALYPNYPVYLDDVLENFETPCFSLSLVCVTSPVSKTTYKNDCTLYITFLTEKGKVDALTLYDVKDKITASFWCGLQVQDRYFKFTSVSSETSGKDADIIYFNLPFLYLDGVDATAPKYTIENIETKYKVHK